MSLGVLTWEEILWRSQEKLEPWRKIWRSGIYALDVPHTAWVLMVLMSVTIDAVGGREKLMFLAWKLLMVLICSEGWLCLPCLVGLGHSSHWGQAMLCGLRPLQGPERTGYFSQGTDLLAIVVLEQCWSTLRNPFTAVGSCQSAPRD